MEQDDSRIFFCLIVDSFSRRSHNDVLGYVFFRATARRIGECVVTKVSKVKGKVE